MPKTFQIAIDGYSGCGKSTVSQKLARSLGLVHVDTGTMYRSYAFFILSRGMSINEDSANKMLEDFSIDYRFKKGEAPEIVLNHQNILHLIRTEEVSQAASEVSQFKSVRAHMVELQKNIATQNHVVMDGRDIGSVVLPKAQLKIFLTASIEARVQRRQIELELKKEKCSLVEVQAAMEKRDRRDESRKESPLIQTEDAIAIDNTNLTLDETVAMIEVLAKMRKSAFEY